ncbi:Acyl dehydratase [Amycolatopsis xylanica]|uniref:Acyl dehydratase n=1 Tax=Amycolatopsis xylanica TaxID=589385 RepID=A0A1H3PFM8_9PSEU|nr:MaoC/PaaZ C-terminal domain-containing protein [Amycolatopsis xylanica]SDY99954.1 Acyl dehydratase [Amycolatopsis xylanica]
MNRQALVGRKYHQPGLIVDAAESAAYASCVGDESPEGVAPPFFAVKLVAGLWRRIYQAPELGTADQLVLHAEQRMLFHRPMRIGEELTGHAVVRDVVGFGFGDAAIIRCALSDQDGRDIVVMESTLAVQGASGLAPDRRRYTQPTKKDLVVRLEKHFGEELPQRYADAADDHNPLHLDDDLARQAGHPRRIVHGMCTLATGISALANKLRTRPEGRLSYLRARFTRPVLPGDAVEFTAHQGGASGTYLVGAKLDGRAVLKSTWFRMTGND